MKRLNPAVTALARRITMLARRGAGGCARRVKVKRVIPKGKPTNEAREGYGLGKKATPQEYMSALIRHFLKNNTRGFTFDLYGEKNAVNYRLAFQGFPSDSIVFPVGWTSRREVKAILNEHARKLMEKHPEIGYIKIR